MFSIIVPIYNTKREYLLRCINSLINQTVNTYEIILVDDGSNDECKDFLKQYSKYEKIKIIHKKHEGVSIARNTGIDVAKNDYIIFVDSDDYVEKDMCEKFKECIMENDRPDIVCFDAYLEYRNKNIKIPMLKCENKIIGNNDKVKLLIKAISDECFKCNEKYNIVGIVWGKAYNKEFLIKNRLFFDENIFHAEDLLFNLYAFENANEIYYYNMPIYHYVQNNKSISHNFKEDIIRNDEYVLLKIKEFIIKYNKNDEFYNAFNLKVNKTLKNFIIRCFFNKKNNYKYKEAKIKICELIDKDMYNTALKNLNKKYLGTNQKIIYYCIKHKKIWVLKLITIIRDLRNNIMYKLIK